MGLWAAAPANNIATNTTPLAKVTADRVRGLPFGGAELAAQVRQEPEEREPGSRQQVRCYEDPRSVAGVGVECVDDLLRIGVAGDI